jgi:hypothetical protein
MKTWFMDGFFPYCEFDEQPSIPGWGSRKPGSFMNPTRPSPVIWPDFLNRQEPLTADSDAGPHPHGDPV